MYSISSNSKCLSKRFDFENINNKKSNIHKYNKYHCGDDAWYYNNKSLGVADGVSGWNTPGVSSAFANSLMMNCDFYSKEQFTNSKKILNDAYENTKKM